MQGVFYMFKVIQVWILRPPQSKDLGSVRLQAVDKVYHLLA
jgi:hypothetical protein